MILCCFFVCLFSLCAATQQELEARCKDHDVRTFKHINFICVGSSEQERQDFFNSPAKSQAPYEVDRARYASVAQSGRDGVVFKVVSVGMSHENRSNLVSVLEQALQEQRHVRQDKIVEFDLLKEGDIVIKHASAAYSLNTDFVEFSLPFRFVMMYVFSNKCHGHDCHCHDCLTTVPGVLWSFDEAAKAARGEHGECEKIAELSPVCIKHQSANQTVEDIMKVARVYPVNSTEHPWAFQYRSFAETFGYGECCSEFESYQ